jgi:hypothetical protein
MIYHLHKQTKEGSNVIDQSIKPTSREKKVVISPLDKKTKEGRVHAIDKQTKRGPRKEMCK